MIRPFLFALTFPLFLSACGPWYTPAAASAAPGPEAKRPLPVLKIVTLNPNGIKGLYEIADRAPAGRKTFELDVSAVPGVSNFNTVIASKLAVRDYPDLILYQSGSNMPLYAGGGHLADITETGYLGRFKPGTDRFCWHNGRLFALPVDMSVSGLFYNIRASEDLDFRGRPATSEEFLSACRFLRERGMTHPLVIGARDDSPAAAFNFQYIYQNMYRNNPRYYSEMLAGTKTWNGPDFKKLFAVYGRLRAFANPDALQVDNMEAIRRFAEGRAAFLIGGSYNIADIRRFNSEADFVLLPPPWVDNRKDLTAVSDVDTLLSVTSGSRLPVEAIAFLDAFSSVAGGNLYSSSNGSLSAVRGTTVGSDHSLDNQLPFLEAGRRMEFFSREWIPGIKEYMKKKTQEWFAGGGDRILDDIEREHRRMIAASRPFVEDFLKQRR